MRVDIWSDIRCPFCYIGKRKFELALAQFPHASDVDVIWHSFQLDPALKTQPGLNTLDHLAEIKGMSREESDRMHDRVRQIAHDVGLTFNFDKVVVANSFHAHRLIQLAKTLGLAGDAEEILFKAHFTDAANIDDGAVLLDKGVAAGIPERDVRTLLATDAFAKEVRDDETMARTIGIRGVPFFIFDSRFAVSGAQAPDHFLHVLKTAWTDAENLRQNA